MESRGLALLLVLSALAAASAAVLVDASGPRPERAARAKAFQRLVGGLGFGPAVDLSEGAFDFDPRLGNPPPPAAEPFPAAGCPRPRIPGAGPNRSPDPQGDADATPR